MAVRFKLDENPPRDAEAVLRDAGHDVQTILDERLGGNPDPNVLDACRTESRVLIPFDRDFSDIRLYPPASHSSHWVLRPHTQTLGAVLLEARTGCAVYSNPEHQAGGSS